ncbi:MAG: D-alanine--D-alanine ligase A, partial [SAR324 cluster bacterium]|nr:D-alanine--D-alanine ligase A [SAR324 cluster bacterium]
AKYVDPNGASLKIPAEIEVDVANRIRDLAAEAFQIVEGLGMARVDFFLTKDNQIYINEINTLPGFTSISMYPKLW